MRATSTGSLASVSSTEAGSQDMMYQARTRWYTAGSSRCQLNASARLSSRNSEPDWGPHRTDGVNWG